MEQIELPKGAAVEMRRAVGRSGLPRCGRGHLRFFETRLYCDISIPRLPFVPTIIAVVGLDLASFSISTYLCDLARPRPSVATWLVLLARSSAGPCVTDLRCTPHAVQRLFFRHPDSRLFHFLLRPLQWTRPCIDDPPCGHPHLPQLQDPQTECAPPRSRVTDQARAAATLLPRLPTFRCLSDRPICPTSRRITTQAMGPYM